MLQSCVNELDRIAPGDPETERARALQRRRRPNGWVWAGWLAIAFASLATLGHALWRAARRRFGSGRMVAAASLVVGGAVLVAPRLGWGAPSEEHPDRISKWGIDDENPEGSVPTMAQRSRNPLEFGYWLQDLAAKATTASKKGNHQASIKYFRAMVRAVPDRAVAYSRLCDEYGAVGETNNAIAACGAALQLPGVKLKDFIHYIDLILNKPGDLSAVEVNSLWAVIESLKDDPTAADMYSELECQIATRVDNFDRLKHCANALAATAPGSPATIVYQWTLATKEGDWTAAQAIVEHGRRAGVPPEALTRLQNGIDEELGRRRNKAVLCVGGGILVLAAAIGAIVLLLRRRSSSDSPIEPGIPVASASGSG
jgi:hypothetical protein